jgi:hypothetical protein
MKFYDWQSSERCIRKLISRHCLDKTRTRWNDFLFLITDGRDFRPQTCTNGLVFSECKHIKNSFEDVTLNLFFCNPVLSCLIQSRQYWWCKYHSRGGSRGGGRTQRAPPPKIGKNMIFFPYNRDFHTKCSKNFRGSLHNWKKYDFLA